MMLIVLFMSITLASCSTSGEATTTPQDDDKVEEKPSVNHNDGIDTNTDKESTKGVGFIIHFEKKDQTDGKYNYNLWLWQKDMAGADYQFNGTDDFGAYAKYKFSDFSTSLEASELGFIIKTNQPWDEGPTKDFDGDRFIDFTKLEHDKYGYYHVWLLSKDKNIYTTKDLSMKDKIESFEFSYNPEFKVLLIVFTTNNQMSDYTLYKNNEVILNKELALNNKNVFFSGAKAVSLILTELPDLTDEFKVEVTFKETNERLEMLCDNTGLFQSPEYEEKFYFDGELGAIYSPMSTEFRVWSPISSSVKLRVYDSGTPVSLNKDLGNDTHTDYDMEMNEKGVWISKVAGDLEGKYYTYIVTNNKYRNKEICDPYAKSCGVNGIRGMIVDFNKTNPANWDKVKLHEYNSNELTVYETHIADLTSSKSWGGTKENSRKFKGFYEAGTTYTENGVTVSTGFDHIKELGVNAVQILPFFDAANDEVNCEFNWGYNPLNYNSLDGSYSSNPYDGYVRIKEFKELIKAYNEAGINIIMDVVYNHVNSLPGSAFDVLMPGYYYRYSNDKPSNGSGCGNETASERAMYRKFMIDSTEFWASEYKLGGFRFDLMGIHDIETMNKLTDNLHKNVSSYVTVYGEPWAGGTTALPSTSTPATQANMHKYEGYGCFNDKMRDALIKGGLNSAASKGWVTNDKASSMGDLNTIVDGIRGIIIPNQDGTIEQEKCVNYVTCHDNFTLYDRIKAAGITDEDTIKKMAMLANSVVFTSQGTTFMLAGEEFLRTKNGNSNSYNASYELNALDYSLKVKNLDMFHNYQKLIALKQNKSLLSKSNQDCAKIEVKLSDDGSMFYFDLIDSANNEAYRIIHCNGNLKAGTTMNLEGYSLYLDTLNIDGLALNSKTSLSAYQTLIVKKAL